MGTSSPRWAQRGSDQRNLRRPVSVLRRSAWPSGNRSGSHRSAQHDGRRGIDYHRRGRQGPGDVPRPARLFGVPVDPSHHVVQGLAGVQPENPPGTTSASAKIQARPKERTPFCEQLGVENIIDGSVDFLHAPLHGIGHYIVGGVIPPVLHHRWLDRVLDSRKPLARDTTPARQDGTDQDTLFSPGR